MHALMAGCLRARTRRWARIEQTTVLAESSLTARVDDDLLRQDLAAVRRGHFLTIAMTALGPARPLSFRGLPSATDPLQSLSLLKSSRSAERASGRAHPTNG